MTDGPPNKLDCCLIDRLFDSLTEYWLGLQVEEEQMLEMWVKEETSATRTSVLEKWTRLQGMPQHQAMLKYMSVIKEWPGYGSTLFDVEVRR